MAEPAIVNIRNGQQFITILENGKTMGGLKK